MLGRPKDWRRFLKAMVFGSWFLRAGIDGF